MTKKFHKKLVIQIKQQDKNAQYLDIIIKYYENIVDHSHYSSQRIKYTHVAYKNLHSHLFHFIYICNFNAYIEVDEDVVLNDTQTQLLEMLKSFNKDMYYANKRVQKLCTW